VLAATFYVCVIHCNPIVGLRSFASSDGLLQNPKQARKGEKEKKKEKNLSLTAGKYACGSISENTLPGRGRSVNLFGVFISSRVVNMEQPRCTKSSGTHLFTVSNTAYIDVMPWIVDCARARIIRTVFR
jgi:hypothetical protein